MNWEHFRTFVWLRWRLLVNQLKRGGLGNRVLLALLGGAAVVLATVLFAASLVIGLLALRGASDEVILYVWDGVVLALLFFWTAALLSELQRSEDLSLDKFLHLPVSLSGAFVVNYLSSLISLNLLLFVPTMVGLSLGLAIDRGPKMLLLLPAVAALLLMITAVTHQFQGWLASLMVNQRRRRTIIVTVTVAFVLLAQLPNLVSQWSFMREPDARVQERINAEKELARARSDGLVTQPVYEQRLNKLRSDYLAQREEISRQKWEKLAQVTTYVSLFLPPAWMPLGAKAAAEGKTWPVLLATLGMTLIGTASLWRSYRTTLRIYTGQFNASRRKSVVAMPAKAVAPTVLHLLEKQLPWVPEQASAVAVSSFRALLRAPEIKMLLLSPIFMMIVLGPMIARGAHMPEEARPLLGFGATAFILLGLIGLVGNQFGIDRSGFQMFMLCGAPRQDILLGKNLATAPFALGMGLAVAIAMQIFLPVRFALFLAVPLQLVSMYLLFCLLANWLSIHCADQCSRRGSPQGQTQW